MEPGEKTQETFKGIQMLDDLILAIWSNSVPKEPRSISIVPNDKTAKISLTFEDRDETLRDIPSWIVPYLLERLVAHSGTKRAIVQVPPQCEILLRSHDGTRDWRATIKLAINISLEEVNVP